MNITIKIKNYFLLIFFFLILLSSAFSCKEDPPVIPPPPPPDLRKITLTIEGTSCTEVWIKIKTDSITLPTEIKLKQDADEQNITLTNKDTLFYIDSLTPNQTYNYQAILNTDTTIKSETITAQTLAPTSHNFSFTTYEFGEPLTGYSSILYDVAIIDENNIWAVGEIYVNDSLGQTTFFNAVHWDGSQWELKKITVNFHGNLITPPLEGVLAFSSTDIWFVGSLPIHGNGENWVMYDLRTTVDPNISVSKAWGINSNDIYFVGRAGSIAHYNGSQWTKIASGTDLPLTDIHGKNENEVYVSGAYTPEVKGILLKGNSNGFSVMINSEIINENQLFEKLYGELASVWVDESGTIYTGGNILFQYKNNKWDYVRSLPENYLGGNPGAYYRGFISSISGNASNDYIIAGDRNTLKHFNGISWEQIGLPYSPSSPIIWYQSDQKGNTAIAVGDSGSKAIIIKLNK